ncbi:hypothetical protein CA223_06380 [Sphingomonas koreensis]|jgi:hypothetical protein|uniref:Uncharacterized protein n=1 Tax=Sphingomonas koreensis TaxID=93064 RepID=A0A1L6JC99_9SPHN|nr:hypothetical protein [Sphingomonas koreensis]APR53513.1 hypothetical protein BRX40_14730 [Sphingomonas koreensis]MDC7809776.1 hypothetical protein [Sphingomonas koreensis]RSU19561.1 hypothetical protein CA225_23385 [Sphingomonas koreensis]RSU21030.1 hypothetical protein CA222_19850 [Sphingomonas koreensis]RSU24356.1 hypothetical protein CA224_01105 [Sphingomonas koreensis]
MIEFTVFLYGLLTAFVLMSAGQNRRLERPNPAMVTAVGWGLFSMSSTLAVLLGGVSLALALGMDIPGLAHLALR